MTIHAPKQRIMAYFSVQKWTASVTSVRWEGTGCLCIWHQRGLGLTLSSQLEKSFPSDTHQGDYFLEGPEPAKLRNASNVERRNRVSSYSSKWPTGGSSFPALPTFQDFMDVHCVCGMCVFVCMLLAHLYTHRRTHIGNVISEPISVLDGLGLPKRPFKRKLLKDDYRIETPSFKSARGKLL